MDLDVIIVNWNGGSLLRDCLRSLVSVHPPFAINVVVVDNDSRDGSPDMVVEEFPGVQMIHSGGNLGFGRGNNLARSRTQAPAVLFLNPDTVVPNGALEAIVNVLVRQPEVGAVGCKMTAPDGSVVHDLGYQWFPTPWTEFLHTGFLYGPLRSFLKPWLPVVDPHKDAYVSKLYGGCLLARRVVLDQVGWFDERYFMYAEDVDLCRTIHDAGWKLFYTSHAEIRHVAGGTSSKAPSHFPVLMKCASISLLIKKYHGHTGALAYRLAMLLAALVRLLPLLIAFGISPCWSKQKTLAIHKSIRKYWWILLWCLGILRPAEPVVKSA